MLSSSDTLSAVVVIEDAIVQAADMSFSGSELGEALTDKCADQVPPAEILGTD